jgi:uncharacterized protein (DUF952 family)
VHYFHIATRAAWAQAQAAGEYRPASLQSEGFIHLSLPEQVVATANRFFRGQRDLVLLQIEVGLLRAPIRMEMADGQQFPHLYGPLNLEAVRCALDWSPGPDGTFTALPPGST